MKKKHGFKLTVITLTIVILASCSSAPKNPGDIITMRSAAEKELALGNREASHGNYETAIAALRECKRKAILSDDWGLIIRTSLSLGNVLFTMGNIDSAFAEWEEALELAQKHGNREILSIARIYAARGKLLSGRASAQSVLDEVTREAVNIKTDNLHIAFSWQVRALALKENKSYREAENAVKRSLDIHTKENSLENVSYDWYLMGSIRSLSGNTQGALQALESAIQYDRRIENSFGLAASWRAMGDVYTKAGNMEQAAWAYTRAKAIYVALGRENEDTN
jgi:tetratricopeptide (TPR) repeat protein